jgi:hypothetical protein
MHNLSETKFYRIQSTNNNEKKNLKIANKNKINGQFLTTAMNVYMTKV